MTLRAYFPLAAGILINLSMGLLYGWSVLLAPLEESLDANRASVSLAYSLAFIFFTLGGFVMYRLLRWFSLSGLALAVGTLGAAGLAIAGFGGSLTSLIIGFGVAYGFAAGVSYFLAMTAASVPSPLSHSVSLSINMSSFAIGGVLWPPVFDALISGLGAHGALEIAALALLGAGALAAILLKASGAAAPSGTEDTGLFRDILTDQPRVVIAIFVGFTLLAFAALMVIGHAAGMAAEWQAENVALGPMITNLAYIGGALLTGQICRVIAGRFVLVGISVLTGGILLVLWLSPSLGLLYVVLALTGASFGGAATAYPVTITGYYGVAALPRVYGRLGVAYGLGGLLGPLAAGAIYDANTSYLLAIIIAAALALVAAAAHGTLPRAK